MFKCALLIFASGLFGQTQPGPVGARPEIRGVVREPGTNAPIAGVEVTVDYHGPTQPQFMPSPPKSTVTVTTGDTGEFSYSPADFGFFNVKVKKAGYTAGGQTPGMSPTNEAFTLSAASPLRELHFFLSRPVTVTGRAIDEATDKPVPGLHLSAVRATNFAGRRMFLGSSGSTGPDGHFLISGQPGDYVVEIQPQVTGADRVRTVFTDADLDAVDADYAHTFWPGGRDQQAAIPTTVTSGATLDLGLISVRKVSYYRVHVRVASSDCLPGEPLSINENTFGSQGDQRTITLSAKVQCGIDLLITGFAPGSYRLILTTGKGPEQRRMASVPFIITDKNVEVTASLQPGLTLEGKYVVEKGAQSPDFTTLHVPNLSPLGGIPFGDVMMQNKVASDGTFRVTGMPAVDHRIIPMTIPGFYVKEVRFNGAAVTDGIVPLEWPAMQHSLTLLLDDKPAAITGTVMDGDKPVASAYIVAARWPLPLNQFFIATAASTADDQGRFQITNLAPGEYRFVAVRHRQDDLDRAPGKIEAALAATDKTDLSPGTLQTLSLKPTDLR